MKELQNIIKKIESLGVAEVSQTDEMGVLRRYAYNLEELDRQELLSLIMTIRQDIRQKTTATTTENWNLDQNVVRYKQESKEVKEILDGLMEYILK